MHRIWRARENILGSTVRLSHQKSIMSTPLLTFMRWQNYIVHKKKCDVTVFYWLVFASSQPMWIFGTHEKVAISIPTVTCTLPIPIPIFDIFMFPFSWESHGNGNPIPMHISTNDSNNSHQQHANIGSICWPMCAMCCAKRVVNVDVTKLRQRCAECVNILLFCFDLRQFQTDESLKSIQRQGCSTKKRSNWKTLFEFFACTGIQ